MFDEERAQQLLGRELVDRDGNRIGPITEVFVNDSTLQPTWVTARTGWFGASQSFVPLDQVQWREDRLWAAYDTDTIKDAPRFAADQPLTQQDEDLLHEHYRVATSGVQSNPRPQPGDELPRSGDEPDPTGESQALPADSRGRLRRYGPPSERATAAGDRREATVCARCGALIAPDMDSVHHAFHADIGRPPGGFARHDIETTEQLPT